jgi:hypothetical protein
MMRLGFVYAALMLGLVACQRSQDRHIGQTSFVSAPPGGEGGAVGDTAGAGGKSGNSTRAVEETDIYRLDGNRLYTLNGYRGLLVFDLSDVDHPRLLGRSPIYGWPIEMVVHGGFATVVVSDWCWSGIHSTRPTKSGWTGPPATRRSATGRTAST